MIDEVNELTLLGKSSTHYELNSPSYKILETFPNKYPYRDYIITHTTKEFTSLCPKTGQPDFAQITITYVANLVCVESKSLKLYLFSYRGEGSFMETICNRILEDLITVCNPKKMRIEAKFAPRGGVETIIVAEFVQ